MGKTRELKISPSYTSRSEHSLNVYLAELEHLERVSVEEEVVLAKKIRQGDQQALDRLVKANLRFVVSCAKKYQYLGLSLNDLVNEGNLGLIRAARLFDETKGFKFISYAVWWIREAMMRALQVHGKTMRLSASTEKIVHDIRAAIERLEQELQRAPTEAEVGERLGFPEERIREELSVSQWVVSLDVPMERDPESTRIDFVADEGGSPTDILVEQTMGQRIGDYLELLGERERRILEQLYGLDGWFGVRTGRQVAQMNGMSDERVRQISIEAMDKIREAVASGRAEAWN